MSKDLDAYPFARVLRFRRQPIGAWVSVLLVVVSLWGCATPQTTTYWEMWSSSPDRKPVMVCDLLYFGLATPRGEVTDGQWLSFLDEVVTPRFPDGLTAWEAKGQWRGRDGVLVRERTKVLQIVHPKSQEGEAGLHEIIAEYKKRFQQESVMRIWIPVGVSF